LARVANTWVEVGAGAFIKLGTGRIARTGRTSARIVVGAGRIAEAAATAGIEQRTFRIARIGKTGTKIECLLTFMVAFRSATWRTRVAQASVHTLAGAGVEGLARRVAFGMALRTTGIALANVLNLTASTWVELGTYVIAQRRNRRIARLTTNRRRIAGRIAGRGIASTGIELRAGRIAHRRNRRIADDFARGIASTQGIALCVHRTLP